VEKKQSKFAFLKTINCILETLINQSNDLTLNVLISKKIFFNKKEKK